MTEKYVEDYTGQEPAQYFLQSHRTGVELLRAESERKAKGGALAILGWIGIFCMGAVTLYFVGYHLLGPLAHWMAGWF